MEAKYGYLITIITATYNSVTTLEQTITSVVKQDYNNIEYIIIDGGSTDGTVDIIKKYENKLKLIWISEPDNGIYDAFNKGIDLAAGDYIQFLGSDDSLYNSGTISRVVEQLDDDTDILSGSIIVVDEDTYKQFPRYNHHALDKSMYRGGMIPHPGMFVKTSLARKYKFNINYKIAADYRFFLQCYYDNTVEFKFVDDPIVFFANSGSSSGLGKSWEEDNRVCQELGVPFYLCATDSSSFVKHLIKKILLKVGLLSLTTRLVDICDHRIKSMFIWKKHTCDNPICRWCGRGNNR